MVMDDESMDTGGGQMATLGSFGVPPYDSGDSLAKSKKRGSIDDILDSEQQEEKSFKPSESTQESLESSEEDETDGEEASKKSKTGTFISASAPNTKVPTRPILKARRFKVIDEKAYELATNDYEPPAVKKIQSTDFFGRELHIIISGR